MGVCDSVKALAQYDSPKYVRIPSVTCGCVKISLYLAVAVCICCIVFIYGFHQKTDEVNSSVRTSVKGVAYINGKIWDTAEYTIPMQATNSFFVMTNLIQTENQEEKSCPEYPFVNAICSSDKSCVNGSADIHSNGIQTGKCVNYNATVKTCEIRAWCPVESMGNPPEPAILSSSEDFTVLIKNNIQFPKFNYTMLNFPQNLNTSCTYNKITSPLCPIFRLGYILQEAKQNFSEMAVKGGIIAIEINWNCNLDKWYDCSPQYSFRRLDDKKVKPGFYIRHAKHYKLHGKEMRTLFKAYGIRFDVLVFGTGRKFSTVELIRNLGSMITYFGLVVSAFEIALCASNCCRWSKSPFIKIYNQKKYETVLNPNQVMYVSYVDEPHVTLVKKPLKTSLQHAQSSIVESHPVKFCHAGSCCTSKSNENHDKEEPDESMRSRKSNKNNDNEEHELKQPLGQEACSPDCQKWCCCGECHSTERHNEQLCCRRKEGRCITTSESFQELVLSSDTLKKALLYKDPFADLTDSNIKNQLRHLAYKQYILWRFGSFDLEDRAVIPSCCRWKIRNTYPKPGNNYSGFEKE